MSTFVRFATAVFSVQPMSGILSSFCTPPAQPDTRAPTTSARITARSFLPFFINLLPCSLANRFRDAPKTSTFVRSYRINTPSFCDTPPMLLHEVVSDKRGLWRHTSRTGFRTSRAEVVGFSLLARKNLRHDPLAPLLAPRNAVQPP